MSGPRALGLRVKLGWAVGIVVEPSPDGAGVPHVVGRDDLHLSRDGGIFAYHAALDAPEEDRAEAVAQAAARAVDAATDVLLDAVDEHDPSVIAVVVGRGVRRIPLERILASSQLLHTAEAEVVQDAFVEAADRLEVACVRVPFADVEGDEAWPHVDGLARSAGRPWQKDHKFAATAAWIALRGREPAAGGGST